MTAPTLTTADGVRLTARWWAPPGAVGRGEAVVVVHGFCGSKDAPEVRRVALSQAAAGRRVLTFDLRGHGGSGGSTTLGFLERLDVDAAVRAARADDDVVVVVGASMGGVAGLAHLASATGGTGGAGAADAAGGVADGGVLVATPAHWRVPRSARGVLAVALTQTWPGRAVAARRMGTRVAVRPERGAPPVERMATVTRPVAVVHGLADRFVPPAAARALHDAGRGPRRLDLVPGMGHGLSGAAVDPIGAAVDWVIAEVAATRGHMAPRGRA